MSVLRVPGDDCDIKGLNTFENQDGSWGVWLTVLHRTRSYMAELTDSGYRHRAYMVGHLPPDWYREGMVETHSTSRVSDRDAAVRMVAGACTCGQHHVHDRA